MKKFFKYLWYLLKHKWYVFIKCLRYGLFIEGILHDISKFAISEFIPYMNYFYGGSSSDWHKWKDKFNLAWLKHQKRNKHHWQYWVLQEDSGEIIPLSIPTKYLQEMVADWIGAGKAIHGKNDLSEWYRDNKDKIIMEKHSREYLEFLIGNKNINNQKE